MAPAIGTSHGVFKFRGKPRIDFERLKKVKELTGIALVLHGASSVYPEYVEEINEYGGELEGAVGLPEETIKEAVKLGVNKINTDTDLRLAFMATFRKVMLEERKSIDPRKYLKPAMEEVKKVVKRRIRLSGSSGKAELFKKFL